LCTRGFSIALDGYAAGQDQSHENPLGVGGTQLHEWVFATESARAMHGLEGGASGLDDTFIARGTEGIGATIMRRNMFGPIRGPWTDEEWKGWWGEYPPYHHPVFVLTHHPREPITMQGGPRSTSSTTGSRRRSSERSTPPTATMSCSAAARPRSSSTSAPV
jgi:dihydrofolate reductase